MTAPGLFVSELARRTGTTRKALRVYEASGLIAPAARTPAGYRVFGPEAVSIVSFVVKARRAGFTVAEIRDIVKIRRSGRAPCSHVRTLIETKLATIDRELADLQSARDELAVMRKSWGRIATRNAAVCPHIEGMNGTGKRRKR
jgi:DNA-binding transcriptional MerR regulator